MLSSKSPISIQIKFSAYFHSEIRKKFDKKILSIYLDIVPTKIKLVVAVCPQIEAEGG